MGATCLEVGCRVHCDGELATVHYVGPISGLDGVWLGVEWDNSSRGKHSGSYDGVTYFTTRIPGAGSFVRVSKADTGVPCSEAVRVKYGRDVDSNRPPCFINLPQASGAERHIEMVGMEKIMGKQSNFSNLTEVVLSGMLVNGPGPEDHLKGLIPSVQSLDLSQNLLSSWSSVNGIVRQLSRLSTLTLSKNRLRMIENRHLFKEIYQSIKTLILNEMSYSWQEILCCAQMWPSVEELYLLDNGMSSLEVPPADVFSDLRLLSLNNNPLRSWEEVSKLGTLRNLEKLDLDNTCLESIEFPGVPPRQETDLFPKLTTLSIKRNLLKQWKDISELSKLRSLSSLMVTSNPIMQTGNPETARQLVIAKLLSLTYLNRTKIERSERRGAELDYLKRHRNEWAASCSLPSTAEAFSREHPSYETLLQRHGAPDESEVKAQSTLIKDNLIYVRIFSPLLPEKPELVKKLPAAMTVGKLKALVQRIFKVTARDLVLTRIFNEDENQRTEMDNNLRQLSFYSVSDRDKISVEW